MYDIAIPTHLQSPHVSPSTMIKLTKNCANKNVKKPAMKADGLQGTDTDHRRQSKCEDGTWCPDTAPDGPGEEDARGDEIMTSEESPGERREHGVAGSGLNAIRSANRIRR